MCCTSRAHVSTTSTQRNEWREGRTRVDANFEIPLGWLRNVSFASSPSNANGDESFCGSFDSTDMLLEEWGRFGSWIIGSEVSLPHGLRYSRPGHAQ